VTPIIKQILAEFIPGEDDTDVTGDEFTQSVTDKVITYPDGRQHKWDEDGNEFWLDSHGELHSDTGPAAIYGSGAMIWFKHGQYHRDDGPAMVLPDGTEYWYQNGQLHRDNGPAVKNGTGEYAWYQHGKLHRDGGPAMKDFNGTQWWYNHGHRHAEAGPAVLRRGGHVMAWYDHDQLHRSDGPAIMRNGDEEYWVRGKRVPAYTGRYRGEAMPRWLCSRAVLAACAA